MPTEEMQRSGEAHRMVVEHQERKRWRACLALAALLMEASERKPHAPEEDS